MSGAFVCSRCNGAMPTPAPGEQKQCPCGVSWVVGALPAPSWSTTTSQRLDAATVERFREAIVTIIGRCEALEDEAADELAKEQPEHAAGFYRGQKTTAKSLRRHLADLARPIALATDPHQHGGKGA